MNTLLVKTKSTEPQRSSSLSIVSLDSLQSSVALHSGAPHQISPGITVSVLQSSAEALIEINESAAEAVLIDGKPASELVSVKPGQIIQIAKGQFAVLKSLQGMIAPRPNDYVRPAHVTKMIQLVLASMQENEATNEAMPAAAALSMDVPAQTVNLTGKSSQINPAPLPRRTIILAGVTAFILGAGYHQMNAAPVQPEPAKIVHQFKSSIKLVTDVTAPASVAPAEKAALKISAVDALRAASGSANAPRKYVAATKVATKDNSAGLGLSAEDRETVVEYKLEARFDRRKAREKMQKLAQKFTAGTKARAEVDRAYGSM